MEHGHLPTFSVVIAAYQAAAFVGRAVRSALDQEPPPIEVIVGDDGSTDDLSGALAPFGSAVRCVRIEHAGEAAAKNAAAAVVTGDFLAFLDADDRFLPGRLAAIGRLAAERPEVDVITTDAHLVHDGRVVGRCYTDEHRFAEHDQRKAILARNFVFGLAAVRRARFEEVGGFDPEVAYTTDWDLWVRLVLSGSVVALVPEVLAEYHLHDASMSARRAAMSRGRLQTLARAAARADLTDGERAVVVEAMRVERAKLARHELSDALAGGGAGDARRAACAVAVSSGHSPLLRLKALMAAVAPAVAARRVRSDHERSFTTVGDRRLPRP